jgi:proteasome lid subunit RPN8/RPN11
MLKITQPHFDELRRHGEETYPHECCGVLLGDMDDSSKVVRDLVRCTNTRTDSPQNRYHIDPAELVRILHQARDRGLDIVGFYHSHPDHPARWSATDLEDAHWLGCSYVITSVEQGRAAQTNSFALLGDTEEQKRFEDEALQNAPEP